MSSDKRAKIDDFVLFFFLLGLMGPFLMYVGYSDGLPLMTLGGLVLTWWVWFPYGGVQRFRDAFLS